MQDIEIYYESIRQVYKEITEWEKRPPQFSQKLIEFILGVIVSSFALSLIPILPSVIVFAGSRFDWHIGTFSFSQSTIETYALAWLISTAGSFLLLLGFSWVNNRIIQARNVKKEGAPQTLSSEQLTFIFIYGAYKELKIFFISRVDQHVKNSLDLLKKLENARDSDQGELTSEDIILIEESENIFRNGERRNQPSLIRQINIAREFLRTFGKYLWFQIDEETKSRLQALISFQKKILIRLQKREDLPAVLAILENLSKFFYAFLPEHQTNMDADALRKVHSEGIQALNKFIQDVNNLIEYPVEHTWKVIEKENQKSFIQKLKVFYFDNVFFRFIVWLIFLLVITSGLVYLVSLKIALDINIMVSMIIATSITAAAALAVFSPKGIGLNKSLQKHNENKAYYKDEGDLSE